MVEDICFHLTDLVQNSIAAGSTDIHLEILESEKQNILVVEISDNGRGMDMETLKKVQDPFFTTKSFKKVGLGIPLFKATAQACHGDFAIRSDMNRGTEVKASMQRSHPDCPPLGNLPETVLGLLVSLDAINLQFSYRCDRGDFSISSSAIRRQIGTLHFSHPEVYNFLREYIRSGLGQIMA
ncbi:MAG: sensor histidine kinase [Candidatus Aminicenantes bacterium]|nr:sensor histidine kinase [Candidatus Aminicenantes bacterium]